MGGALAQDGRAPRAAAGQLKWAVKFIRRTAVEWRRAWGASRRRAHRGRGTPEHARPGLSEWRHSGGTTRLATPLRRDVNTASRIETVLSRKLETHGRVCNSQAHRTLDAQSVS